MSAEGMASDRSDGAGSDPSSGVAADRDRRADHGRGPRGVRYRRGELPGPALRWTPSASERSPRITAPGALIEGNFKSGDPVVVVEDVITSGGSARKAVAAVEEAGGTVLGVLAVVDREQGGKAVLETNGRRVVTLTTASDLGLR